jgi:hypothetical protein
VELTRRSIKKSNFHWDHSNKLLSMLVGEVFRPKFS